MVMRRRVAVIGLAAVMAGCAVSSPSGGPSAPASPSATADAEPAEHRIGVRTVEGQGELFDRQTGETFVARGANLIRLDSYHNTFGRGSYDRDDLDAQLAAMAERGYNVVRVFLDQRPGALAGAVANELSGRYLDNVVDFLRLAKARGVYVMFTQDWLPEIDRYAASGEPGIGGINAGYLTAAGVFANRRFFADFVTGLLERNAPMDAIWAYELRNELYLDGTAEPFSLSSGEVRAASGEVYDLANPARRRALLEDGVVFWANAVRAEILEHDPTALVTIGFFVPQAPNPARQGDSRIIETQAVIERSELDFIDLHGYPGADLDLARHLENFAVPERPAKPMVMGEMGVFRQHYPDVSNGARVLIDWQADSCARGFDGWLLWTWDSGGAPTGTWNGTDEDALLADVLSPRDRPDPCAREGGGLVVDNLAMGRPATASSAIQTGPASAVVDGSMGASWNSGGYAPAWIEIDLGEAVAIGEVRLIVEQLPAGATEHRILGASQPGAVMTLLHTFAGVTDAGDVLSFVPAPGSPAVRILRIETVTSPSWVAWREIEVSPIEE